MGKYHKITIFFILLLTAACLTGLAGAAEWTVTKNMDTDPGTQISDLKSVTLRQAVEAASPGDTILFGVDTVSLSKGELVIKKDLTFDSKGQTVTIQRSTDSVTKEMRLLNITKANVTFIGISFMNGFLNTGSGDGGAALIENSNVTFKSCQFRSDKADDAGAICSVLSDLTLENCAFSLCSAVDDSPENATGGALVMMSGNLTANDTQFVSNSAGYGGAVRLNGGSSSFKNCTFRENKAGVAAGSVQIMKNATASFDSCSFSDSSSVTHGAVYVDGDASLKNCYFNNDTAVSNNSAPAGGAVFVNGSVQIDSSVFADNAARLATDSGYGNGSGGAVYVSKTGKAVIKDSSFYGNTARYGGAVYVLGRADISGCSLYNNSAKETGGALACYSESAVKLSDTAMIFNTAAGRGGAYDGGGAVCVKLGSLAMSGNVLADNTDKNNIDVYCEEGTVVSNGGNAIRKARGFSFPQTDDDVSDLNMKLSDYLVTDGGHYVIASNERAGSGLNYVSIEKITIASGKTAEPEPTTQAPEPTTSEPTTEPATQAAEPSSEPSQTDEKGFSIPAVGFAGLVSLLLAGAVIGRRGKI